MENNLYSEHFSFGQDGTLHFDNVSLAQIAQQYGTAAYVMSESTIIETCRAFYTSMKREFGENFKVAYASKAFSAAFLYPILLSEGLHADVVSGGELYTALLSGFPASKLHFHGNNKTDDEIEYAVKSGIGSMVIDNYEEIFRLDAVAKKYSVKVNTLFRVKPGIDAHTHESIQTGQNDSKFGFGIVDGEAMRASKAILSCSNLIFKGIHCHIGSQIFETSPYYVAADVMVGFMSDVKKQLGHTLPELILGGGFGIKYMPQDKPVAIPTVVEHLGKAVRQACAKHDFDRPEVVIEPGRSLIGTSGVTLYTVGGVKDIKDARRYVSVDGGMTDNPRCALYQAQYDAVVVNRASQPKDTLQTIAGRCCESGDMVSKDVYFQKAEAGDILCVFATGAYCYAMASNYNRVPRPPVILITKSGETKVVVRRESYEDIVRNDVL